MDDRELSRMHSLESIAQRYADENVELRARIGRISALVDMQHDDSLIRVGDIRRALDGSTL